MTSATITMAGVLAFGLALGGAMSMPHSAVAADFDIAGDAAAGEKAFRKCKACHQVGDGAKARVGPVLNGILGRPAGSMEGFKYSDAMAEAGAEGLVWTPDTMAAFLTKPKAYLSGTKMSFAGLRKDSERLDVIAYLASFQ